MSYLEQSTRYVPYNDKPGGRWRYHAPAELAGTALESRFDAAAERAFQLYSDLIEPLQAHLREQNPKPEGVSNAAYRSSIRGKACDILRGLLPAATASNLGIYGSAQGYEALVLRLLASPLAEARATGEAMLAELKKLIPTFMERVERPDRGGVWRNYFQDIGAEMTRVAGSFPSTADSGEPPGKPHGVRLGGRDEVVAAALYEYSDLSGRGSPRKGSGNVGRPAHARLSRPTLGTGRTGATSRAAPSSALTTASTWSPTTAPSATCSATASSRSSGSA